MKTFITKKSEETRKLGELLAQELHGGEIICLSGELGNGKTTFAQGILKGLGAKGPYTSPTFVVMKHYELKAQNFRLRRISLGLTKLKKQKKYQILNIYHIDAYRVGTKDILDLGWEEIISGENNIVIVEWAEKIKSIVPKSAIWIKFEYLEEDKRKIAVKSKCQNPNVKSSSRRRRGSPRAAKSKIQKL